jgi:hypothetical protein
MIHWVQDFTRIGEVSSIDEFDGDPDAFRAALDVVSDRADVRCIEKEQSNTVSKAADPGKFKDERKWPEWEPAFVNNLSTIPGVSGVPLYYVVCKQEEADPSVVYESFNKRAIACLPLTGAVFQADARKVHQLLKSFLQTETAEQWIKPLVRKQSGRADMKALRTTIAAKATPAAALPLLSGFKIPHYKSERAMQFSSFLDKLQNV